MKVKLIEKDCKIGIDYTINKWLEDNKHIYFEPIVDIKFYGNSALILYNEKIKDEQYYGKEENDMVNKEFNDYIHKAYPYCEPCINCKYWRMLSGGKAFTKDMPYNRYNHDGPACHYCIDTLMPKNESPIDGTCSYFKERVVEKPVEKCTNM